MVKDTGVVIIKTMIRLDQGCSTVTSRTLVSNS